MTRSEPSDHPTGQIRALAVEGVNAASDRPFALSIPVTTVWALINLACDLQGKSDTTLFDDDLADPDDLELDIREDRGAAVDPAEARFRTLIEDLPEESQIDLVALVWLGRDGGDWPELRDMAADRREVPTASYLRAMPLLPDHLAAGLAALEQGPEDMIEGHPI